MVPGNIFESIWQQSLKSFVHCRLAVWSYCLLLDRQVTAILRSTFCPFCLIFINDQHIRLLSNSNPPDPYKQQQKDFRDCVKAQSNVVQKCGALNIVWWCDNNIARFRIKLSIWLFFSGQTKKRFACSATNEGPPPNTPCDRHCHKYCHTVSPVY